MDFVNRLAAAILELSKSHRLLIVVGGGRLARKMIGEAAQAGASEAEQHMVGILASRINAGVLMLAIGENVFRGIPKDEKQAAAAFKEGRIVVTGGFRPGQTTDAVTLQAARAIGADLVIKGTDVKGVYDRDPKKHPDARLIRDIGRKELARMSKGPVEPGKNTVIDPVAAGIILETGIRTMVLDIRDLENLRKAVSDKPFEGTTIR